MSFAHCYKSEVVRAAATVSVATNVDLGDEGVPGQNGLVIVIRSTGRTVGTLAVTVVGGDVSEEIASYTSLGTDLSRTISTGTITYIALDGCFPSNIGVVLTPAGGFDGSVSVEIRYPGQPGSGS